MVVLSMYPLSQEYELAFPVAFNNALSPEQTNWSGPAFKLGISFTKIWNVSFIKHPKLLLPVNTYWVVTLGLKTGFCEVLLFIKLFGSHK